MILDEATSALDAESETLVNQALHTMLEGNNTTISIAHRLSTIQRSDKIVCLSADGVVAQVGTYKELSEDKEGAFAKLMEWQMSGGQAPVVEGRVQEPSPEFSEEELLKQHLEAEEAGLSEGEAVDDVRDEDLKAKGEETVAETVSGGGKPMDR